MVAKSEEIRDKPMSILEHIYELKRRLMWVAVTILIGVVIFFVFYRPVIDFLLIPAQGLLSPTSKPVVTGPMDFLEVTWKLGVITGLDIGNSHILYRLLASISPAISRKTIAMLILVFPVSVHFIRWKCGDGELYDSAGDAEICIYVRE